jgi:hypothetical protein
MKRRKINLKIFILTRKKRFWDKIDYDHLKACLKMLLNKKKRTESFSGFLDAFFKKGLFSLVSNLRN